MTKLEYLRKQQGLTQTKLAELIGINKVTLNLIEKKKLKAYPKVIKSVSEFFGKSPEELFEADGEPKDLIINM